ncbi:tetratricopeptide repeat protein 12-like isoform X2 [Rhinatrema bivittatum]|uniref:tetratricopeptide repeat protein 12-like isoform X2 n=1 Tax=Rhinatrema bivittatum TaxID=194408 RepID=UPI001125B446|nr:tetratricopeptide repeat protein 12-like isoform X2 [Rhinatrema bivittatum]
MAGRNEENDLEKFLQNVDEISELIEGLSSEDLDVRQRAVSKADERISAISEKGVQDEEGCRTLLNRTVINISPDPHPPVPELQNREMNKDGFLAFMEKDAKERAEKRKHNTALANALKEMGNKAFAKGDYEDAIQRYSEGLDRLRDMEVLYTNRAQAYIKLEKYQDAVSDCEWALKARQCYKKILEMDPKWEKMIKDYTNQSGQ